MGHTGDDTEGEGQGEELNVTERFAKQLIDRGTAVMVKQPMPDEIPTVRVRLIDEWMTRPGDKQLGEGKGQELNMPRPLAERLIREKKAVDLDAKPKRKRTPTKKRVSNPPKNKAVQAEDTENK